MNVIDYVFFVFADHPFYAAVSIFSLFFILWIIIQAAINMHIFNVEQRRFMELPPEHPEQNCDDL